jgi:hypothetical protein
VLAALGRLDRGDRGLELAIAGFLHVGELLAKRLAPR